MSQNTDSIIQEVSQYYSDKLAEYGTTPKGVDWNSEESQILRFKQLTDVLPEELSQSDSILDYGCGYGSLLSYLRNINCNASYAGFDVSKDMLEKAQSIYVNEPHVSWYNDLPTNTSFSYIIASGIFNVKMKFEKGNWEEYIYKTLDTMHAYSSKGFSFNMLTSYSDAEYMREDLYYAVPEDLFSYCKRHFSFHVALKHDYPLYEFTILVRKD